MAVKKQPPKVPLHKRINIEAYPYVECREQHKWLFYDGVQNYKVGIAFRTQKCANCPTKRHSQLSLRKADRGQLVKPSTYSYPDDYQVPGGLDKADRGLIRMHNFLAEIEGG